MYYAHSSPAQFEYLGLSVENALLSQDGEALRNFGPGPISFISFVESTPACFENKWNYHPANIASSEPVHFKGAHCAQVRGAVPCTLRWGAVKSFGR